MSFISKTNSITCTEVAWLNKEEEIALRNSSEVINAVKAVRNGNESKKRDNYYRLVNGVPLLDDNEGVRKNDMLITSNKFVLDYDVHNGWKTAWNVFKDHLEEWGILHFEVSLHYGAHITLRRTDGLTIDENITLLEQKTGLSFDHKCQDLSRAIFLVPMTDVIYVHEDYYEKTVKELPHEDITTEETEKTDNQIFSNIDLNCKRNIDEEECDYLIRLTDKIVEAKIDLTSKYKDWIRLGFIYVNYLGIDGLDYFHKISRFYPNYDWRETEKLYFNLLQTTRGLVTIGTLKWICQDHGITI